MGSSLPFANESPQTAACNSKSIFTLALHVNEFLQVVLKLELTNLEEGMMVGVWSVGVSVGTV